MIQFIEDNWVIFVLLWLVYELTINGSFFGRKNSGA
jgi:hypothetical protein